MKKKVVHITTVHNAKDSRIFFRECISLAKDYNMTLIAPGQDNEQVENIQILKLGDSSGRLSRISCFQIKALKLALSQKANLYHFHDPELIPTGIILKMLGFKVIYDVHEDVPQDILLKKHIHSVFKLPLALCAKYCEKLAGLIFDGIITVTPTIAQRFPKKKVSIVRNYPSQPNKKLIEFNQYKQRTIDLIYIGSITENRGLNQMISAATEERRSLTLIGNMRPDLQTSFEEKARDNNKLQYIQWMPSPQLGHYLDNSKIGLLLLHPTPTFLTSYPLKLFEYMAAGLPIIASNFPEWHNIIEQYQCGLSVDPLDIKAIKDAINYLLSHPEKAYQMGQNGMDAIRNHMNWENESKNLLNTYHKILQF